MNTLISRTLSLVVLGTVLCGSFLSFSVASASSDEPSCWISADPMDVTSGESVTLRWDSDDADSAWISDIGDVDTHGSYEIDKVYSQKTYTLTVSGNGETATCSTTVSIESENSDWPSCSIYAVPSTVQVGKASTLRWESDGAENASLTNYGSVVLDGSRIISPNHTTTYVLTVWNSEGQKSECQTTVFVDGSGYPYYGAHNYAQAPSCTITMSGYNGYGHNQTVSLTWRSTNATSAYISQIGAVGMNGIQTVTYPNINSVYTLSVSGPGGNATCSTSGVNAPAYPYSTQYPYVSLTQIPYTGLDLGTFGTIVYSLILMSLVASVVRLAFYFRNRNA